MYEAANFEGVMWGRFQVLEPLLRSPSHFVLRTKNATDKGEDTDRTYVIKAPTEAANPVSIATYRKEYELFCKLKNVLGGCIATVVELLEVDECDSIVLVFKDVEGSVLLNDMIGGMAVEVEDFFWIALKCTYASCECGCVV